MKAFIHNFRVGKVRQRRLSELESRLPAFPEGRFRLLDELIL